MPKRKDKTRSDGNDSESDVDMVDVDFEFFDPSEIDFLALKRMMHQLFQSDTDSFHIHELVELVIGQPLLGTTVKIDGKESDPYAFLTVLNMNIHKDHPSIKALAAYFLAKSAADPSAHSFLKSIISPDALASPRHVGLLLGERLVNMPVQIIPPMYRMLGDEMQWAIEDNEPYRFDHYIIVSRLYRLTTEEETSMIDDADPEGPPAKKVKVKVKNAKAPQPAGGTFSFHPEDDTILKMASHHVDYDFTNRQSRDAPDAFGLDTAGRMMVIAGSKFGQLVARLDESHSRIPPR